MLNPALPKYMSISNEIRRRIRVGVLKPGSRLPSEQILSSDFGVSLLTLRHGLQKLAEDGFIERHQGRGTFVAPFTQRNLRIAELYFAKWTNPLEDTLLRHVVGGIVDACTAARVHLNITTEQFVVNLTPQEYLESLAERRVDGIIFVCGVNERIVEGLPERVKAVAANVRDPKTYIISVEADYVEAGRLATEHLIRIGHRNIGFVGGVFDNVGLDGFLGYRAALAENGLPYEESRISMMNEAVPGEHRRYSVGDFPKGVWLDGRILRRAENPTAMVAGSRAHACVLVKCIEQMGLSIPQDVAIVGIDESYEAEVMHPPLSTAFALTREMGHLAVSLLSRLVEGQTLPEQKHVLMPRLIVRESCGSKPPATNPFAHEQADANK